MTAVRTTCPYCGVGCGVLASRTGERTASIAGDMLHPANGGRLCSKGTHLGETIGLQGRLLAPEIGGRPTSWGESLRFVADGFSRTIAQHGPDSVAFYVSGQLLTEDYYVANKLMKGFIGSANIDTNSRLCMSSAVSGHVRAFGEDVVPCTYEDLELADLILLVGSNTAWCHPIIWQRIEAAREKRGTKIVVIDPRRTETAERADLHLPIRSGADVTLFNGLLAHSHSAGLVDWPYIDRHVTTPPGFWEHILQAGESQRVADTCDLDRADIDRLYELFDAHPRTVTAFCMGVNQSGQGSDKVNAITNLHLATGRINKPGAAPFSVTGQPNAMGGREVGGLASALAAHMGFTEESVSTVQRFWNAPSTSTKPGMKAVDMFQAIHDGRIKALWVMGTNPAVSMPRASQVREALERCPLVVVSDIMADTDTGRFAHVKLPALGWGEKDGTVTNSDRCVSRQRPFLQGPPAARPDWWLIAEVGKRMGWAQAFDYSCPAEVFREHCRLTAFENAGSRKLDMTALGDADYDSLEPTRWGGKHPFADGRYSTPDGRANLVLVTQEPMHEGGEFPLLLNTGRYRDQWHTMTRTGLSPRLSQHRREPLVEIHPSDAATFGIEEAGLARLTTSSGSTIFRVSVTENQRRGELFVPIHWTDRMAGGGRTGLLMDTREDALSGQPGFKAVPATIAPVVPDWRGFLVKRGLDSAPHCLWWTRSAVGEGELFELAGMNVELDQVIALLPEGIRADFSDASRGVRRVAVLDEDSRLSAALFIATEGELPSRDWILSQLAAGQVESSMALLAGRPSTPQPDRGAIVCVCFDVGMKTLLRTIGDQRLTSVEEVARVLRAGSNCGSCRPAIRKLIDEALEPARAVAEPPVIGCGR